MSAREIVSGLYLIDLGGGVNAYLIESDDDGLTLVDTGFPKLPASRAPITALMYGLDGGSDGVRPSEMGTARSVGSSELYENSDSFSGACIPFRRLRRRKHRFRRLRFGSYARDDGCSSVGTGHRGSHFR